LGFHALGCFLLFAQGPDGQAVCWLEWYFSKVLAYDAGTHIAQLCAPYAVELICYDEQMGYQTGAGELTILEEFVRGFRETENAGAGPKVGFLEGTHGPQSRLPKLARAHAWLTAPPKGPPALRFHPRCIHAIRTIPALTYSTQRPEDVNSESEDHAYDALCLWLSSRPQRAAPLIDPTSRADRHPGFATGVLDGVAQVGDPSQLRKPQPWERNAQDTGEPNDRIASWLSDTHDLEPLGW